MNSFEEFNQNPANSPQNTTEWDSLGAEVAFSEDAKRQQRKIMVGALYGREYALSQHDFATSSEQEEAAMKRLAEKDFRDSFERSFLNSIQSPSDVKSSEELFTESFAGRKHESRILAYMTGLGFDNYGAVNSDTVTNFLNRYPLPMDFDAASDHLLDEIKYSNPPEKYDEYKRDMANFKNSLYGKRQEYWDQMKVLNQKVDAVSAPETTQGEKNNHNPVSAELNNDKTELNNMFSRAKMDADPITIMGKEYILTPEVLEKAGLKPEYLVEVGGKKVGLSGIFDVGNRDCAIGYVEDENGDVKVRGYYQSGSQGLWRYLPDYIGKLEGGLAYYGKSGFDRSEDRLNLPWQLQQKLGEISMAKDGRKDESVRSYTDPWVFLAGTARRFGSEHEIRAAYGADTAAGDFYQETTKQPLSTLSNENSQTPPEFLTLNNEGNTPDYSKEVASFNLPTREYGNTNIRVYNSKDGQLEYMIAECSEGAWVASVQPKGQIGSTGCKTDWVIGGNIVTPLHEYASESKGYGESMPGRSYVSMWRNYLSKIPLIQKYLHRNMV